MVVVKSCDVLPLQDNP